MTADTHLATTPAMTLAAGMGLTTRTPEGVKLDRKRMDQFARRQIGFDWVHMGTMPCTIGALADTIRAVDRLSPPRSGHLGNWHDIAAARAGAIDYNHIVCAVERLGHPLIYDFNMTETEDLNDGDWIYLPGSIVSNGMRKPLRLFTMEAGHPLERDRMRSYLSPFVLVEHNGGLVPLVTYHRQRWRELGNYHFRSQATAILSKQALITEVLTHLIGKALAAEDATRALGLVVDRVAWSDGSTERAEWVVTQKGAASGQARFESISAMVEATLLPLQVASDPDLILAHAAEFDRPMLLCSTPLVSLLLAITRSHYPDGVHAEDDEAFDMHVHWGALGMAGYPPKRRGHFSSHVRYARPLYDAVVKAFPSIKPVYFTVLPSAIYLLWPHSAYPSDDDLIADLISRVRRETDALLFKTNLLPQAIEKLVAAWLEDAKMRLSSYFLHRFSARRSVLNTTALPHEGSCVKPEGFDDLSVMQASMVVGALLEQCEPALKTL